VPWTEKELERLETVWVQAYKWAWGMPRTTASDVFTLPSGMEYLRPVAGEMLNGWRDTLGAAFPQGGEQCGRRRDVAGSRVHQLTSFS
jgi:hypothetical protein